MGALNLSGDTPILLGPDGPSLGGFACPVTVTVGHRWKMGQIRPGDTVRLAPVPEATADALRASDAQRARAGIGVGLAVGPDGDDGVLGRVSGVDGPDGRPDVVYLRGADDNVLVEYGPMALDLGLRLRVHALSEAVRERVATGLRGVVDLTPGVRSLHVHVDPAVLSVRELADILREVEAGLPATEDLVVPSRKVHLPMSFDDPCIADAVTRYAAGVRPEAPWLPSNIEFIRRVNGLGSVEDVYRTMFEAEYLVLGLGDVYLGAPLAVPLDPRHRLLTTKYNPARTWTAADTVGLGGAYLCVYGMESPGGYQLVGRTVPIWSGHRQRGVFEPGKPWLLRFFDRIVWHPVSAAELVEQRTAFAAGRLDVEVEHGTFSYREHLALLRDAAAEIEAFSTAQHAAFAQERAAWEAAGEFAAAEPSATGAASTDPVSPDAGAAVVLPEGCVLVEAPMVGSVWRVEAEVGAQVCEGDPLVALEAMKLELGVQAPAAGRVAQVLVRPGEQVGPGSVLVVLDVAGA